MKIAKKSNSNDTFRLWGTIDVLFAKDPEKIEVYRKEINEKRFRVADTPLSYRQINYLDNADILKDSRKSEKEWRKFSLKEIVFFVLGQKLRKYGLSDDYLKKIGDGFFKKENSQQSDFVVIMTLSGLHIIITQEENGEVYFNDAIADDFYNGKQSVLIKINLNEVVNDVLEKIRGKREEYKTYDDMVKGLTTDDLSGKETEILEIIRNKDYKTITIRKKDNEEFVIKGEKAKTADEKELMKILREKDFIDINITKRNGVIANVKVKDNFKL